MEDVTFKPAPKVNISQEEMRDLAVKIAAAVAA
jgi:hypothetical protein